MCQTPVVTIGVAMGILINQHKKKHLRPSLHTHALTMQQTIFRHVTPLSQMANNIKMTGCMSYNKKCLMSFNISTHCIKSLANTT